MLVLISFSSYYLPKLFSFKNKVAISFFLNFLNRPNSTTDFCSTKLHFGNMKYHNEITHSLLTHWCIQCTDIRCLNNLIFQKSIAELITLNWTSKLLFFITHEFKFKEEQLQVNKLNNYKSLVDHKETSSFFFYVYILQY